MTTATMQPAGEVADTKYDAEPLTIDALDKYEALRLFMDVTAQAPICGDPWELLHALRSASPDIREVIDENLADLAEWVAERIRVGAHDWDPTEPVTPGTELGDAELQIADRFTVVELLESAARLLADAEVSSAQEARLDAAVAKVTDWQQERVVQRHEAWAASHHPDHRPDGES